MPLCKNCKNPCVEYADKDKPKTIIHTYQAMACVYRTALPNYSDSIEDIISKVENTAKTAAQHLCLPDPSQNALSKCRGDWFEVLVAVFCWNFRINNHNMNQFLFIKLPNIKTFDFRNLFTQNTRSLLNDLDKSLRNSSANLTTSNPDIIVIKKDKHTSYFNTLIKDLSIKSISKVFEAYKKVATSCEYQDIKAGIGIKTSLRPDRRLQLVYEGNILKSIFFHFKMRTWQKDFAFKYYVITKDTISKADLDALQTAATHTILFVDTPPERCVDSIYAVSTYGDIEKMIKAIALL